MRRKNNLIMMAAMAVLVVITAVIPVAANPVVTFSGTPESGTAPLDVTFTDSSTGNSLTDWIWDFGDGNIVTYTVPTNPSHSYISAGLYSVNLTVIDADGSTSLIQPDYINVSAPPVTPVAIFMPSATSGIAPLEVTFTDQSTNAPTAWAWSFWNVTGNNTQVIFDTGQNPTLTFGPGNYSIVLDASNSAGHGISAQVTFINVSAAPVTPVALFTPSVTSGIAPLGVTFTDHSANTPTAWNWSFKNVTGNNTQIWFSTMQNPTKSFGAGNYSIVLDASNSAGHGISAQVTFINVSAAPVTPVALFTPSATSGTAPLAVTFTDQSTNSPTDWAWWFRNVTGNNTLVLFDTEQNPTLTFGPGNYSIVLRASNTAGHGTSTQVTFINVSAAPVIPVALFTPSVTSGIAPLEVTFTDQSTNTPTDWAWSFKNVTGNNTPVVFGTGQNPTQAFGPGNYSIVLDASNSAGHGISAQVTFINVSAPPVTPVALFTPSVTSGFAPFVVTFTDHSANTPTDWNWSFRNITPGNNTEIWFSTVKNPTKTFGAGNYSIVLNASNSAGYNISTQVTFINVSEALIITKTDFTANITYGIIPLVVKFTDTSTTNPTHWTWYFGDENFTQPWMPVNPGASWSGRYSHTSVVLPDGSIVLMGGINQIIDYYKNDVWRSTNNGASWNQLTTSAGWPGRESHTSVVLPDGSIVLMGGTGGTYSYMNDVWRSVDKGATWNRLTASAAWSGRESHTSVVIPDGSIVLMGGYDGSSIKNDVWRSADKGATWNLMTANAAWSGRNGHTSVAMPDGSIVLMGGYDGSSYKNDTWRSADKGITWNLMTANAAWSGRYGHTSVAMPDGSIVLSGGNDGTSFKNDVWRSTDYGVTWKQVTDGAGWPGRYAHTSVAMPDGSIALIGGYDGSFRNDVWRLMSAGSSVQNPSHTYTTPGIYQVALQVYNTSVYNSTRKIGYITVRGALPASPSGIGVYRPSAHMFYLKNGTALAWTTTAINWGASTDLPVTGDWNGDGLADIGIYRPSTHMFYLKNGTALAWTTTAINWGASTDLPVTGDWNGDGLADIGIYRPSTHMFYLKNGTALAWTTTAINWGASTDLPVTGDWNGDGLADIGVYRPSAGTFYLKNGTALAWTTTAINWGVSTDLPVTGDWNGDGLTDIGVYRPSAGTFYLKNGTALAWTTTAINWGASTDLPVTGTWG